MLSAEMLPHALSSTVRHFFRQGTQRCRARVSVSPPTLPTLPSSTVLGDLAGSWLTLLSASVLIFRRTSTWPVFLLQFVQEGV